MELEQLKSIWQKTTTAEGEDYFISRGQVQAMIEKRSNMAVSKIKRGVRNKVIMAGSIGSLMVFFSMYVFSTGEAVFSFIDFLSKPEANFEMGIFYLIFGLVIGFISAFNAYSYKKILDIEEHDHDLKSSTKGILLIIRKAMRTKMYSDAAVVPLTICSLVVVDLFRGNGLFPNNTILLVTLASAAGFGVFSYFLTRYGQHKRYGQQISELEECLQELEE